MLKRGEKNSWFYPHEPDISAAHRLFCFPYAGGGASMFYSWQSEFPQGIQVCPIQLPGRENRLDEAPFTNLFELVKASEEVLSPYLDLPFSLFGHSMGAKIAFELSRKLKREKGVEPTYLFVSGCQAPHIPEANPSHHLPKKAFIRELRRYSGTPEAVLQDAEFMEILLPLLRADFTLVETYEYMEQGGKLTCPIWVLGGEDDKEVSVKELEEWGTYTSSCIALRLFSGDHFFIRSAQTLVIKTISSVILGDVFHVS